MPDALNLLQINAFLEMPPLIPVILILVFGIMLQCAAGFGYGMFIVPLLVLLGLEPYEAITIALVTGVVQTSLGSFLLRRHVMWKQIAWMLAVAALAIPLGVFTLKHLSTTSPTTVRRVFGAIIFVAVLVQWLGNWKPSDRFHPFWGVGATALGGYMSGLAGMGGPPVVIWIMSHTWSNERSRATLWAFFTGMVPIQLALFYSQFGREIVDAAGLGLVLIPAMLLGVPPGLWIGHRLSKPRLRQLAFVVLLLISLYAMFNPAPPA